VYWSLYKIIKEYSWGNFNKSSGLLLALSNKKVIIKVQAYVFFIWFSIFEIVYKMFELAFKSTIINLELRLINRKTKLNSFFIKFFYFILGSSFIKGLNSGDYKEELTFNYFKSLIVESCLACYLFNMPSNALFFYDGNDSYLLALKFKHSINLEYVFGMFPTIIIGLIIVPSMYLLYSNESDINPCITVKVIGHQWYWSYEGHHWCIDKSLNRFIS
jgi:hypothetical protein